MQAKFLVLPCLAIAMVLSLAACGGEQETSDEQVRIEPPMAALRGAGPDDEAMQAEIATLPAPYNEASFATGQRLFKQCQTCHLVDKDAGNRVGPNLHNIFGRHVGELEGFAYSNALQEADFLWTTDELEQWLANPRSYLPGNRMSFAGFRRPDDRRDVIAYLLVATNDE